ncbi:substrate-binding domain-containing protein [Streptomyces canus]|uniref:substrate-binding domain-containing protein n=1 Tax=Streptomyces canus TaxID=58343 RepID=UPI00367692A9
MKHHGLTDRDRVVPGGLTKDHGAAAARTLLAEAARPTAVLAFNDHRAIGVLDTLLRARIPVPDENSVVGFDESHLALLAHVQLTTGGQEARHLARRAVSRAVARLERGATDDEREVVVTPHLVI